MAEETLTSDIEETTSTEPEVETPTIPEGFDDTLYDVETQSLKLDAVRDKFTAKDKEIESYKKQALDLRRKLSKGVETPDSVDKYEYTPDAKYDAYVLNEDSAEGKHIKETLDDLSKFALKNGLSLEASKNLKTLALEYMEKVHILDTRSDEEKKAERKQYLEEQRKILGDNAEKIIKENFDFYSARGPFTQDERNFLKSAIGESAIANNILRKMREFMNTGMTYDIPANTNYNADIDSLRKEYLDDKTSDKRREQILYQAAEEGWKIIE